MRLWYSIGRVGFWLSWPLVALYLRIGTRTRVLIEAEGKVLVVKGWLSSGKWCLPGGGLHYKEDPLTGALREVREETNLILKPNQVIPLGFARQRTNGLSFGCERFGAKLEKALPVRHTGLEVIECAWVEPTKLNATNAGQDVLDILAVWNEHLNLIK